MSVDFFSCTRYNKHKYLITLTSLKQTNKQTNGPWNELQWTLKKVLPIQCLTNTLKKKISFSHRSSYCPTICWCNSYTWIHASKIEINILKNILVYRPSFDTSVTSLIERTIELRFLGMVFLEGLNIRSRNSEECEISDNCKCNTFDVCIR